MVAVDTDDDPSSVWLAKRPNGSEIRVCATHLMSDSGLSNAAPAAEGSCAFCSELVSPTRHAVDRWLERVGGRSASEAGLQILEFASRAFTPATTPKWIAHSVGGDVLLLNARYAGIALVKRRSTRDPAVPLIVTVLTSAGPTP
jgi:hypothetical protein